MGQDSLSFNVIRKKTPFQKHKELEEDKKRRADEEAAKLYEEFVESFGGGGEKQESGPKAFVRGGTIQQGNVPGAAAPAPKKSGGKYVPSFLPPQMGSLGPSSGFGPTPIKKEPQSQHREESTSKMPSSSRRGQPRNIDVMLEDLKKQQEEREERQRARKEKGFTDPFDDGLGSLDDGDPFTTNLYVGNLAPDVDEEVLKREFVRYGPIASVKVMWPRDEDQRRRSRNCGFVAFMTREAAVRAKDELNGIMLHDNELKIGWGKAITIPPVPMYSAAGVPAVKQGASIAPPGVEAPPPWVDPHAPVDVHKGRGPDIVVRFPADVRVRYVIDTLVGYVLQDGCAFEQAIMSYEADNPEFAFLYDLASPDHVYYRWRLYSLAQGDTLRSWRIEPFVLLEGGPRWVPPSMTAAADGSHQTAAQRGGEAKDKDLPLSDVLRDKFEDLLRALTLERRDICEAMVFSLDNAASAGEVVEILSDSLTLPETPVPTKAARLMLVSDILHNSTAPVRNASRYRSLLETALPDVFESLQEKYRSLAEDGRMVQDGFKRHVLRVLRIWRSWFIFSDDFLNGLQATFLKSGAVVVNPPYREELELLTAEELELRCRRNGLSRAGGREAQLVRLLSLRAYTEGDVKPEPAMGLRTLPLLQDPVPQGIFAAKPESLIVTAGPQLGSEGAEVKSEEVKVEEAGEDAPQAPVSKWTLVDYDDDPAETPVGNGAKPEEDDNDDIFSDVGGVDTPEEPYGHVPAPDSSPESDSVLEARRLSGQLAVPSAGAGEGRGGAEKSDAMDEGRRQRLRQVEVAVMMYREELEDDNELTKEEVDARVDAHRAKLVAEANQPEAPGARGDVTGRSDSRKARERDKTSAPDSKSDRSATKEDGSSGRGGRETTDKSRDRERDRSTDRSRSHSRSRSRSLSRDRERERERERSRDRERERERERERSREREKERERAREKERERERGKAKEKERERDRDEDERGKKERGRERGKEKEREEKDERSKKDRGKTKERDHDTEKDRDRKERDREAERERERDREREREREKERERGRGKEKDREKGKDKDKDKDRERDRDDKRKRENSPAKAKGSKRDRSRSRSRKVSKKSKK